MIKRKIFFGRIKNELYLSDAGLLFNIQIPDVDYYLAQLLNE